MVRTACVWISSRDVVGDVECPWEPIWDLSGGTEELAQRSRKVADGRSEPMAMTMPDLMDIEARWETKGPAWAEPGRRQQLIE